MGVFGFITFCSQWSFWIQMMYVYVDCALADGMVTGVPLGCTAQPVLY